jgi:hypothetical protein
VFRNRMSGAITNGQSAPKGWILIVRPPTSRRVAMVTQSGVPTHRGETLFIEPA